MRHWKVGIGLFIGILALLVPQHCLANAASGALYFNLNKKTETQMHSRLKDYQKGVSAIPGPLIDLCKTSNYMNAAFENRRVDTLVASFAELFPATYWPLLVCPEKDEPYPEDENGELQAASGCRPDIQRFSPNSFLGTVSDIKKAYEGWPPFGLPDSDRTGRFSLDKWQRHVIDPDKPWQSLFLTAADLDGDGWDDIVTGGWWYQNPRDINDPWQRRMIGEPFNNLAAVYDFDNDGDLDLLGTQGKGDDPNSAFAWARNNCEGHFSIIRNVSGGDGNILEGIEITHLLPNSPLQVVLSWRTGASVQLLTVPANPSILQWPCERLSLDGLGAGLDAGDVENDGDIDLLLGGEWLRQEKASWQTYSLTVGDETPDRVLLADMNLDGRLDAVIGYRSVSSSGMLAWYEQPVDVTEIWKKHPVATIVGPMSLDVGDIDGDGDLDIVVGEHNLTVPISARLFIYENCVDSGLVWREHLISSGDELYHGAQLVDIDRDGDLDILSMGWSHGRVLLFENKAILDGSVETAQTIEGAATKTQDESAAIEVMPAGQDSSSAAAMSTPSPSATDLLPTATPTPTPKATMTLPTIDATATNTATVAPTETEKPVATTTATGMPGEDASPTARITVTVSQTSEPPSIRVRQPTRTPQQRQSPMPTQTLQASLTPTVIWERNTPAASNTPSQVLSRDQECWPADHPFDPPARMERCGPGIYIYPLPEGITCWPEGLLSDSPNELRRCETGEASFPLPDGMTCWPDALTFEPPMQLPTCPKGESSLPRELLLAFPAFKDVPLNHWAYHQIQEQYLDGYISRSQGEDSLYYPEDYLTRGEMAVMILRSVFGSDYQPSAHVEIRFNDVDHGAWVECWAAAMITKGYAESCSSNSLSFCPDDAVTQAEAAIAFLRVLFGPDYAPSPSLYGNPPASAWYLPWMLNAADEGLLPLCPEGKGMKGCAEAPISRAQAVYLIARVIDSK